MSSALDAAAERVGHQLLGHRADEQLRPVENRLAQRDDAVNGRAVGQLSRRVDRTAGFLRAPRADRVEVLEREADRIHHLVAASRTSGWRDAPPSARAASSASDLLRCRLQLRHVRWRRRHRQAHDVLEDPFAAQHRRRSLGVRRHREHAALCRAALAAPRR